MSFAPNIQPMKNDIQQNQTPNNPRQFLNYDSPNINNSVRMEKQNMMMNSQQHQNSQLNLNQRLELIESNLNRVCNQHDALMPLLNILEAMPQIQKNENEIKALKNNQKNLEQKIKNLETLVNQNSNQHVFGTIERNFKQQNQSIGNIKNQIKEIEQNLQHNQKVIDAKSKEEAQHVFRNVETRLEKNKRDIQNILAEFKNSIQIEQKKQEDMNSMLKNPSMIQNQNQQNQTGDQGIQEEYSNDIQNLYRELGMIRSEIELLYDKERRNHIFTQLDQEQPLQDTNEKELVVANLEQSVFFEELERFDRENQERLLYELNCLEDKLQVIQNTLQSPQGDLQQGFHEEIRNEITFIEDRFFNLKQQIKGSKKKYLVDVRKLEDRLENLYRMKDQIAETIQHQNRRLDQSKHISKHIQQIENYNTRIDRINQNIVDNVESLQNRQKLIDEKLLQIHKSLLK